MAPPVKYAKSGDVHIAYQVIGDAPVDLVLAPGAVSHLDVMRAIELFGTEVAPIVEREVAATEPRNAKAREPLAQSPGLDAA